MTVSLIRRSRAQLASAASGSAGIIATLATADRLLWLEDHPRPPSRPPERARRPPG